MQIEWRTIQFFLEEEYICEVEIDSKELKKLRCSCPAFQKSAKCKHTKYCRSVMDADDNDGHYPLRVSDPEAVQKAKESVKDPEDFRDFIIKYAKVEVI